MQAHLQMADVLIPRPQPSGLDVQSQLHHFAIITYAFDPARFADCLPARFQLDTVMVEGEPKALISVVPFLDVDFTSAVFPFPKLRMGQTNYRIYIIDTLTNEKCVWFLGTTLDSWTRLVPARLWKLPWYPGKIRFDCVYDSHGIYSKYRMETQAAWAPARVELISEPNTEESLPGFPDLETGLVFLTHPLRGYYYRRDGKLGSYCVWHEQLVVTPGKLIQAQFGLLDRLGLVSYEEQQHPHSLLLQPRNEFTVYLPPVVL